MPVEVLQASVFAPRLFEHVRICSGPPMGRPEIFVPALCSAVGLMMSVPFLPLLNKAIEQDAVGFLAPLLG